MGDVTIHVAALLGGGTVEFAWGGANTEPGAPCFSHTRALWVRAASGLSWQRTGFASMESARRVALTCRSIHGLLQAPEANP